MATTLLGAIILGCFAGLAPGPFTTTVVATAVERGFARAGRLALVPLVSDLPPLLATAFVLDRLPGPALTGIGVLGGVLISVIGVGFLRRHTGSRGPTRQLDSTSFWYVAAYLLFSPAPWIFWLVVGSPMWLAAWSRSPSQGGLFLVVLFATNIGTAMALAWGASHGSRLMSPVWRRWALRSAGTGLLLAGAFLLWQAVTGDFQAMVEGQRELRSFVEERTGGA